MPNYRRARSAGATWFFTVVTARRRRFLADEHAISILRESVAATLQRMPFHMDAWVILPGHMHAIWTLPAGDRDFSTRWGLIKAGFSRNSNLPHLSAPRRDGGLWQPRFWEHRIRDVRDYRAHMDYAHYNPVKHGLVARVKDWPYSSFHHAVREGIYAADWGGVEPRPSGRRDFGE
ncbi:MAG: transposase [Rhodanobacter sp.]